MNQIKFYILSFALCISLILSAQAPIGYYSTAEGKTAAELKTSLYQIVSVHSRLGYYISNTYFRTTDWHPDGYFWDMYSNNKKSSWSGLNREHSVPKSWFGVASGAEESDPAGTDLHNLYPSDPAANSAKSNFALGEVGSSVNFTNGVTKVGANIVSGYSGTVFEPANEYKGDFARTYMYMVTCYEDYATRWQSTGTSSMLSSNRYPVFKPWALAMLLKWHRQDPVSSKETLRNNEVYKLQNNRNPFVDHPDLAEHIWGDKTNEKWSMDGSYIGINKPMEIKYNTSDKTIELMVSRPEGSIFLIYDARGTLVLRGTLNSLATVDISPLRNGSYVINLYGNSMRKFAKFVVR